MRATPNPFTPPSELWPKYQYRVRYSRTHGFDVLMYEKQPGEKPRSTFITRYGDYGQAMNFAMSRAKTRSAENLRNPNPVVVLDDLGDCAMMWLAGRIVTCPPRATKNPYTPPGTLWPRYELKVVPAESYTIGSPRQIGSRRMVLKWRIILWKFDPDLPRPEQSDVGFARDQGDAERIAFDYARKLAAKEPRNPNDIRVFNEHGQCVWSLHGNC